MYDDICISFFMGNIYSSLYIDFDLCHHLELVEGVVPLDSEEGGEEKDFFPSNASFDLR